jgi:hypothetical protein
MAADGADAGSGAAEASSATVTPSRSCLVDGNAVNALSSVVDGAAGEAAGGAEDKPRGVEQSTVTLVLPSAFAVERWRRPPINAALADAEAALGVRVALRVRTEPAESQPSLQPRS